MRRILLSCPTPTTCAATGRVRFSRGTIPWLTGAEIFPEVLLGVRGPEFRHSPALDLVACTGTGTISVTVERLRLSEADFHRTDPPGTRARAYADGVRYQTPLLIGCIRAARDLIARTGRTTDATDALLDEAHAVRITRLATLACGGAGLRRDHPDQRLYREALVYNLMAQTPLIVDDALREAFG